MISFHDHLNVYFPIPGNHIDKREILQNRFILNQFIINYLCIGTAFDSYMRTLSWYSI
jgi:hypothetical protein